MKQPFYNELILNFSLLSIDTYLNFMNRFLLGMEPQLKWMVLQKLIIPPMRYAFFFVALLPSNSD